MLNRSHISSQNMYGGRTLFTIHINKLRIFGLPKWMAGLHNALTFKPWGTTLQVPTNYGLLASLNDQQDFRSF